MQQFMQMEETIRVLAIGDVIGRPGRQLVKQWVQPLREARHIDLVVANVENAAGGFGVTRDAYDEILRAGVDCMTSGNHIYDKRGFETWLDDAEHIVRPLNFPGNTPGRTSVIETLSSGFRVAVVNPIGRVFMKNYDCPFRAMDAWLEDIAGEADIILVDMHAEASSEKMAMGWFLSGRVSVVWGTHTHVPTADARLLDNRTGYITDLGMTGPYDSVIGMKREPVIEGFLDMMRRPFDVAKNDPRMGLCFFDIDAKSGRCLKIESVLGTAEVLESICNGRED